MQFLKYAPSKITPTSINDDVEKLAHQREDLERRERELAEAEIRLEERERAAESKKFDKAKGKGCEGSATWSLAGRECKSVAQPSNNFNQEGKVVVSIQVDAAGNVVSAVIGNGTTISDYPTIQIALKAARESKFSASKVSRTPRILYFSSISIYTLVS